MRTFLLAAGLIGCHSLAAVAARKHFVAETVEEPENVLLKTADLHDNLLREPVLSIKLENRYKFEGLGEFVSRLIDHHTTLGSVGSSATIARQSLLNYHNSQYFGEIKIGTPGRRFVVVSFPSAFHNQCSIGICSGFRHGFVESVGPRGRMRQVMTLSLKPILQ